MYFLDKWGDFLLKELLNDKINNNKFFTDKKLDITIVSKNPLEILKLAKDFNEMDYNVKIITDFNNLDIGEDCDILISTDKDYNIEKVISRLNLIKVLISQDSDERHDFNLEDIDAEKLLNQIEDKYL